MREMDVIPRGSLRVMIVGERYWGESGWVGEMIGSIVLGDENAIVCFYS